MQSGSSQPATCVTCSVLSMHFAAPPRDVRQRRMEPHWDDAPDALDGSASAMDLVESPRIRWSCPCSHHDNRSGSSRKSIFQVVRRTLRLMSPAMWSPRQAAEEFRARRYFRLRDRGHVGQGCRRRADSGSGERRSGARTPWLSGTRLGLSGRQLALFLGQSGHLSSWDDWLPQSLVTKEATKDAFVVNSWLGEVALVRRSGCDHYGQLR